MSIALKHYAEMKSAGPERQEPIPAHWDIARFKHLLQERDSRSLDGGEQLLRVSQYTGVTQRQTSDGTQKPDTRAESLIGYKRVERCDLVVNIMLAWNGSLGVSSFPGIVSPAYCVYYFKPNAHPRYFHYLLRSTPYKARIKAESTGVVESRLRLYTDDLLRLEAHLPSSSEQIAIARFLDHMDRRIQKHIRAKEKLIALLDEYKQVLIHQAVTGQIDVRTGEPYPEYKESGVEWLGDVPKEWDLVALRYLGTKFGSGVTPRGGSATYTEKGVLFLRSQNIHFDGLRLVGVARIPKEIHETLSGTHVKTGDVLLNITGASIGRVTSVPEDFDDANVNQHVCIIRPRRNRILPEFLAAFLSTPVVQNEIQVEQSGASREGLTLDSIRSLNVVLPSVDLQTQIIDAVQRIKKQIKLVTDATIEEVKLISEYRTRLVADVVTGKLDVRDAAAGLSDIDPIEDQGATALTNQIDTLDLDEATALAKCAVA